MRRLKGLDCILLVDDDEINNFLHTLLIRQLDIDVHIESVLNGREALEYLTNTGKYSGNTSSSQSNLVFLDINMPRMNGWEFLEVYSELPEEIKSKSVITMLTGSINPDDKRKAWEYQEVCDYIDKPLTSDILSNIVCRYYSGEE